MSYQHKQLAAGRWFKFPFFDQMAHIGSEIERTIAWKDKGVDYFCYDNQYRSSDQLWQKYFYAFNYAARLK